MNQEAVRALADSQLEQVSLWAQDELKVRAEKRRQETIAKIKEMAASVGVAVNIQGQRGRPVKAKAAVNDNHRRPSSDNSGTAEETSTSRR